MGAGPMPVFPAIAIVLTGLALCSVSDDPRGKASTHEMALDMPRPFQYVRLPTVAWVLLEVGT